MALFNYAKKEITLKIVYYGPGLGGKTTSLRFIYESLPSDFRSKMISLATNQDRTLFFDFLPIDLGTLRGMKLRLQLYTVPGQVYYNSTRRIVLKGADGVVFVADSQDFVQDANKESWENLKENLLSHGAQLETLPHVIQFNKRDLPNIVPVEEMEKAINEFHCPSYETIATTGYNIVETLTTLTQKVLKKVIEEHGLMPDDKLSLDNIKLIPETSGRRITMEDFNEGPEDLWEEEFEFEEVTPSEVQKKAEPISPTPSLELEDTLKSQPSPTPEPPKKPLEEKASPPPQEEWIEMEIPQPESPPKELEEKASPPPQEAWMEMEAPVTESPSSEEETILPIDDEPFGDMLAEEPKAQKEPTMVEVTVEVDPSLLAGNQPIKLLIHLKPKKK